MPPPPGEREGERDRGRSAARAFREAAPYLQAAWKPLGGAAFGVGGGFLLDRWLGTSPWLLVTLSLLGVFGGFLGFILDMSRLGRK